MKAGWEYRTLGDVCAFENGDRGENYPSKSVQTTTGVPFVNAGHLTEFGLDFDSMNYIPRERFNLLGNGKIRKNDILFCLRGSLGKFASVGDLSEGAIASSLVIVRPQKLVINTFVAAYFQSDLCASMIDKYKNGAAQPNLSAGSLKNFIIPIPPLPEQQRIVTILDEAFEGIAIAKANAEKNLQNARVLFESHVNDVFTIQGKGWVVKTVDQISTNLDSKRIPITKSDRKSGEYPYYGASGIVDYVADYIFDGDTLLVSEDGANLLARSTPIAFSVNGKYWVNNHAHILKFENMATQRFVEFYLESIKLDEYITGAAQPKLNQKALNSIPIPIPTDIVEQAKVVNSIELLADETQRLESIYQQKLAALDALKKSLLDQAFRGELSRNP